MEKANRSYSPEYMEGRDDTELPGTGMVPEENMSIARYFGTRLSTLKPPMAKVENPFKLLRMLNLQQWMFFLVAFFAWSWDAFDFFTVSLTVSDLAKTFDKTNVSATWENA